MSMTDPTKRLIFTQPAVSIHIAVSKLDIYIMEKTGEPPLLLILTQTAGQRPHNCLGVILRHCRNQIIDLFFKQFCHLRN